MTPRTLLFALGMGLTTAAGASSDAADTIVAAVNGTPITQGMVDAYGEQRSQLRGGNAAPDQLLGEVISKELVYQAGLKAGADKDPALLAKLEILRQELIISTTLDDWSQSHPATDAEIKAVYDEAVKQSAGSEYKARHILLETEDEAVAVIGELDGGADFAALAKAKSTGPSGPQGGDLGWFRADTMVAEFAAATDELKKSGYTARPVKTQFGWHVILLEDIRPIAPPPLGEVRGQIAEQIDQLNLKDYIEGLHSAADIEIKDTGIK